MSLPSFSNLGTCIQTHVVLYSIAIAKLILVPLKWNWQFLEDINNQIKNLISIFREIYRPIWLYTFTDSWKKAAPPYAMTLVHLFNYLYSMESAA